MSPNDAPWNYHQHVLQIETHTKCFFKVVNIWNLAVALNYLFLGGSFALSLWISKFGVENIYRKIKHDRKQKSTVGDTKTDSLSNAVDCIWSIETRVFPTTFVHLVFPFKKKIQLKNFLKATIRTVWLYCCSYSPKVIPDPCTTPRCTK